MKIYLVQHGDSLSKEVDPERPLSEKGEQDILALGKMLAKAAIQVENIFHSGIKRAEQTAQILASSLSSKHPIAYRAGLEPLDSVNFLAIELERETQNTMFVGHLPFMAKLVSRLVIDDEMTMITEYRPGTIVCLNRNEEAQWMIHWMLTPDFY